MRKRDTLYREIHRQIPLPRTAAHGSEEEQKQQQQQQQRVRARVSCLTTILERSPFAASTATSVASAIGVAIADAATMLGVVGYRDDFRGSFLLAHVYMYIPVQVSNTKETPMNDDDDDDDVTVGSGVVTFFVYALALLRPYIIFAKVQIHINVHGALVRSPPSLSGGGGGSGPSPPPPPPPPPPPSLPSPPPSLPSPPLALPLYHSSIPLPTPTATSPRMSWLIPLFWRCITNFTFYKRPRYLPRHAILRGIFFSTSEKSFLFNDDSQSTRSFIRKENNNNNNNINDDDDDDDDDEMMIMKIMICLV
ncbi:hypothetical protein V1477_001294, partial [Vespula maculifrons]